MQNLACFFGCSPKDISISNEQFREVRDSLVWHSSLNPECVEFCLDCDSHGVVHRS
jgi:hypothetical protein